MGPNTSSPNTLAEGELPAGLEGLAAEMARLAPQDPADLPDALLVQQTRALYRGPLRSTGRAMVAGDLSYQHAAVLAGAARDLPAVAAAQAEPVLLDAARRLDPPRLRQVAGHPRQLLDPDRADQRERRRLERRGGWLSGA